MAEQSEEASRFILFRLFRLHRKHMALHELDRLVFDRPFWPNVVDSWSHDDQVYLAMSRCFQVTRVPWLPKRRPFFVPFFSLHGSPVSGFSPLLRVRAASAPFVPVASRVPRSVAADAGPGDEGRRSSLLRGSPSGAIRTEPGQCHGTMWTVRVERRWVVWWW